MNTVSIAIRIRVPISTTVMACRELNITINQLGNFSVFIAAKTRREPWPKSGPFFSSLAENWNNLLHPIFHNYLLVGSKLFTACAVTIMPEPSLLVLTWTETSSKPGSLNVCS